VTFGVLFALSPVLLTYKIRTNAFVFLCKLLASCVLMINGIYLLAGTLLNFGDGGELVLLSMNPSIIILMGIIYLLISMVIWSNLHNYLGLNDRTPIVRRILIITGGFAPYMALIFLLP